MFMITYIYFFFLKTKYTLINHFTRTFVIHEFLQFTTRLDTDECANNPCNQWCKNTHGGYVCHCDKGYELQGSNTCVGRLTKRRTHFQQCVWKGTWANHITLIRLGAKLVSSRRCHHLQRVQIGVLESPLSVKVSSRSFHFSATVSVNFADL